MQSRYRNPRDGFRPSSSSISGGRISSFGRDLDRVPSNPFPYSFPRKHDILMEAGRLAAEYLVSRGTLPSDLLSRKFPNGSPPGFERQEREIPPEIRTSALARLGQRREKSRKRSAPYSRMYDSDWSRENCKSRNWMERGRSYSDPAEEDAEFPAEFMRRKGYAEIKSSVSRVSADEPPEEENYELADDNWSKASSSSTKKDQPEADEGSSKGGDEVVVEEVKSEGNDEIEKKAAMDEDMVDIKTCEDEGDVVVKDCKDLLKLCSFTKVPTRPRSSLANKSPKVCHDSDAEMSDAVDDAGEEDCKELNSDENHSRQSDKFMEDPADSRAICTESLSGKQDADVINDIDDVDDDDDDDESKKNDNSCPSEDQAMVQETNESTGFTPKAKIESVIILEEEIVQPETPASFKICDLNLTGSPELSEIHGVGTSLDHPSAPRNEMNKGVSADLSVSMRNAINACDNSQISVPSKVIPVIDLEDDSNAEANTFDSSKHKVDIAYPGLETVLNQETHTDDLPSIQDGYSLEFSEFLGTDISGCPTGQGDLNDIQPGMGLHGAEGYPGVDDHIYVSLDELPIGFMGVWDPPSQDYGKFY